MIPSRKVLERARRRSCSRPGRPVPAARRSRRSADQHPHRDAADALVAGGELGGAREDEGHQHQHQGAPVADRHSCGTRGRPVPVPSSDPGEGAGSHGRDSLCWGSSPASITSPQRPHVGHDAPNAEPGLAAGNLPRMSDDWLYGRSPGGRQDGDPEYDWSTEPGPVPGTRPERTTPARRDAGDADDAARRRTVGRHGPRPAPRRPRRPAAARAAAAPGASPAAEAGGRRGGSATCGSCSRSGWST